MICARCKLPTAESQLDAQNLLGRLLDLAQITKLAKIPNHLI